MAVVEPDTAFWALVRREKLAELALGGPLRQGLPQEGGPLRRGNAHAAVRPDALGRLFQSHRALQPQLHLLLHSPSAMRRSGRHMSRDELLRALAMLKRLLPRRPASSLPQIVFHGAEPLLNREAVFAGIEQYGDDFRFGIQTNATLLDDAAVEFLRGREREHRHFAGCPHGRGGRPHAAELAGPGRPPAGRGGDGAACGLPGLERDLHDLQREPPATGRAGRFPPRARGAHLPDEHPPLHAAAIAVA